uniref:HNH endonuclease signature motif containing protein n=1 Tax=Microbispora cellulosiformans TaxID=2614688 RepID=UPI00178034DF|nr:HNH endonuclease signature motif containing protein [Microbispora cellulosiformans]
MATVAEAARAVALVPVPEAAEVCLAEAEELLSARDRITSALAARVGRVHRAGEAKNHGHASTKLWLRSAGGMTPAGAARLVTMSMELHRLPEVRERFAEGTLPEGIVEAICTAMFGLTDDQATTAERILLELANSAGAAEVAKAGRYLRAVLAPDGHEKDEQADFDRRFLRVRRRRNGGVEGEFYLPVEAAARLQHLFDAYAKPKAEGDDRTLSVRNADALIAFLENKIATELLVLVNAESLPDDPTADSPGADPASTGPASTEPAGTDPTDDLADDPAGTDPSTDQPAADPNDERPGPGHSATAPGGEPPAGEVPGRDSGHCASDTPQCDGDRFGSDDAPMRADEQWAEPLIGQDPATDAPASGDERSAPERSATGGPDLAGPHSHSADGDERADAARPADRGEVGGDRCGGDCPAGDCEAGDHRHSSAPGAAPRGRPGAGADAPPGAEQGGDTWLRGGAWLGGEAWAGMGADAPLGDSPLGVGLNGPPGVWLRGLPGLILATGHLLPASSVHRLARTSTLVRIVMDAAGQVLDMGRKVRLATPAQRRAIFARYATCWVDGCPLPATMCQIDHVENWCSGGLTDLKLLGPACQFHNRDRYRHPTRYTRRKIGDDRWAFTYRNPRTTRLRV